MNLKTSSALPPEFASLAQRIGPDVLARRLVHQARHFARLQHQGEGIFSVERYFSVDAIVRFVLRLSGLERRGLRNYLDVRPVVRDCTIPGLPDAFEGFRLLHITDLHADLHPDFPAKVAAILRATPHDATVVTGDFRNSTDCDFGPALAASATILAACSRPCFGILGNHDFIEMTGPLEETGCKILLNETAAFEKGGNRVFVAGIDDPHFYGTHDLQKVRGQIPPGEPSILLSHSPEIADEAAAMGFSLMLSGHTHGGQICLPGGYAPVVPVARLARDLLKGAWTRGEMRGYTSRGTGACGVAARFNCPSEITVHILRGVREGEGEARRDSPPNH